MTNNLENTLAYYSKKRQDILDRVNSQNNLTAEQIIEFGEEMAILEYKMTALEIAKGGDD